MSFFVSPTDKTEIENAISLLDSNKSIGPNSIKTKVFDIIKTTFPINYLKYLISLSTLVNFVQY